MFDDVGSRADAGDFRPLREIRLEADVPVRLDVLPDGRAADIYGEPEGFGDFHHPPGDNPYGFENTAALVLCEASLRRFGADVGEADLVDWAVARGLCEVRGDARLHGAVPLEALPELMTDHGVPAHLEQLYSLEDLAQGVESGADVLIAVDAATLRGAPDAPGGRTANHLVAVSALARDPDTGDLLGGYVHDPGGGAEARFLEAETLAAAWLDAGGWALVTDVVRTSDA